MDEVRHSAAALLAQPADAVLTLLPDDVWRTARELLTSAHRDAADPLDYALSDFYMRVNVLQVADRLRVQHLLAGGAPEAARVLMQRDAEVIAPLGEHLLEMLQHAQTSVRASARTVPT